MVNDKTLTFQEYRRVVVTTSDNSRPDAHSRYMGQRILDDVANNQAANNNTELDTIPNDLLIKHPLQNKWTLWFFKNEKGRSWTENQREITSFDTVEDFWAVYNHIEVASNLQVGCDYSLFKYGIKPMWEDPSNKRGGRWLINLNKQQRSTDLDNFWLETLLCLIGEAFDDEGDEICGAVVNIRLKGDKIGVWTADLKKHEASIKIGKKLKERLNIPAAVTIGFQAHDDTMSKNSSVAKNKYTV